MDYTQSQNLLTIPNRHTEILILYEYNKFLYIIWKLHNHTTNFHLHYLPKLP